MKKTIKKLSIGRETVRQLAGVEMSAAVGGITRQTHQDTACMPPTRQPASYGCGSGDCGGGHVTEFPECTTVLTL